MLEEELSNQMESDFNIAALKRGDYKIDSSFFANENIDRTLDEMKRLNQEGGVIVT